MSFNILKRFNFYFARNSSAIVGIQIYLTTVNDYSQQLFFVSKLVTDYIENQVELKYVSYEADKIQNNGNDIEIKNRENDEATDTHANSNNFFFIHEKPRINVKI